MTDDELKERAKRLTTNLFRKVFLDAHFKFAKELTSKGNEGYALSDHVFHVFRRRVPDDVLLAKQEEVDRAYREGICDLPTEDLQVILEAHEYHLYRRQQVTIDAITGELLERELASKETPV